MTTQYIYRRWLITITALEFYGWEIKIERHGRKTCISVLDDFYLENEALATTKDLIDDLTDNKYELMARRFYISECSALKAWVKECSRDYIAKVIYNPVLDQSLEYQAGNRGGIWQLLYTTLIADSYKPALSYEVVS